MRRSIALIIAGLLVAAAIVVTAGWFFFVQQTQRALIEWADLQRQNGVDVTWHRLNFSGYPLRIDAQMAAPQLVVRRSDRSLAWSPAAVTFKFSSFAPRAIDFVSPGAHNVRATIDDTTWSALVEAEILQGQAVFPPQNYRRVEQVSGHFADMRITPNAWVDSVAIDRGRFVATQPAVRPADPQAIHPQGISLEFDMAATGVRLPDSVIADSAFAILGPLIEAFSTEIQLNGNLPPETFDRETLSAWRNDGGTIEVISLDLRWGPLRITADGTLALDSDLQPIGAFTARIAGLEKLITAMESGGIMSPNDAAIARITLAVLTRAPDDGGPARAEIPVTVQDRILRLGPIPLVELPLIVWN